MDKLHLEDVVFQLTKQCELECPHCFFYSAPDAAKMLTAEQGFFAVNDVASAGLEVKEFILTGGEPTLWPQIEELIKKIRQQNPEAEIRIDTNGISLFGDDSLFRKFGADTYHLSIDPFHAAGVATSIGRGYIPRELREIILAKDSSSKLVDYFLEKKEKYGFTLSVRWTLGNNEKDYQNFLERYGGNPLLKVEAKLVTATGRAVNLSEKIIGKGVLVSEKPDNFECLMGSSIFLSVEGDWYACYHPVKHTKLSKAGSPSFREQLTRMREHLLYTRLPREGIVRILEEVREQCPETKDEVNRVLGTKFWYRCQPCVAASECGLFNYFNKESAPAITYEEK